MALVTIRIGSAEDIFQYDDGAHDSAVETTAPIKAGPPVDPNDVTRLADVGGPVGNVVGPAASTDRAIARFDGVTGKILQNSLVLITDAGSITLPAGETVDGIDISVFAPTVIVGPAGATNNAIVRFDTATGKLAQNSNVTIDDNGNVTIGVGAAGIDYVITINGENSDGTIRWMEDEAEWRISGDDAVNYVAIKLNGSIEFNGTARIDWIKWTANSVTLLAGASANVVADLQTAHDGNTYDIVEAAATPGIDLIVDFTNVTAFNWVNVLAYYDGSATHAVDIMLYNWNTTAWDTFDAQDGIESRMTNHDFFVPDDTDYIGTGGDAGKVRVRFDHTMAGNASHDLYIDVVALYQ